MSSSGPPKIEVRLFPAAVIALCPCELRPRGSRRGRVPLREPILRALWIKVAHVAIFFGNPARPSPRGEEWSRSCREGAEAPWPSPGPPVSRRAGTLPAARGFIPDDRRTSAHVSSALLGCFLGWRFWLCRKLKHR